MSIHELPTDLIISICHEVVSKDAKNYVLGKLKKTILKSIAEFKIKWDNEAIPSGYGEDVDNDIYEDELECLIYDHIKNLSYTDKNTIICYYGIIKAIKLLHDYQKHGCGDSSAEIREYMDHSAEISIYNDMIELIIKSEIEFRYNWYNN